MDDVELPHELRERYAPGGLLGRGAMGWVIAAVDLTLKRDVAIKLIDPRLAEGDGLVRFRREALVLGRLSHPGVVRVFDAGEAGGLPYLVMDLVAGRSLSDRLRDGPLTLGAAYELLDALLDALAVVHEADVLHRDLKPSNVMLTPSGKPVLIDFGLARVIDASTIVTGVGHMVGTPSFLAPEVLFGATASVSSDVYAVGAIGLEVLTGRGMMHTLPQASMLEMLQSVRSGAYHAHVVAALEPHGKLGALVARALTPYPAGRPAGAAEMRRELHRLRRKTAPAVATSPPAAYASPSDAGLRVAAALSVTAALLAGVAFSTRPDPRAAPMRASPSASPSPPPAPPTATDEGRYLKDLAEQLERWDADGRQRRAMSELGEELKRSGDQAAATRQVRAMLAASNLRIVKPFEASQRHAAAVQRIYRRLWWMLALERIGGPELAQRSRVLPLLPEALRPGAPQPVGRAFDADLGREIGLTTDPVFQGLHTLDGSARFTDTLTWKLRLQNVSRATHAWIGVRVKRALPTEGLRVFAGDALYVGLMTPVPAPGEWFTHALPVWSLSEGENTFRVKLESLLERREGRLEGFVRLLVVLSP